jgi:hypothetical protein
MVVGNPYAQSRRIGGGDAFHAGDAIIHRDQDVGVLELLGECHDFRRQAVTVFKAVGYQIVHLSATAAQRTQSDSAGSGAVGVIVGNDQQFFTTGNGIGQQDGHGADVAQTFRRYEPFQVGIELRLIADAARSIDARQERRQSAPDQLRRECGVDGARNDVGHARMPVRVDQSGVRRQNFSRSAACSVTRRHCSGLVATMCSCSMGAPIAAHNGANQPSSSAATVCIQASGPS